MLWLYLHFPHLLLDHLRRTRERERAMVVVEGSAQRVLQACPAAVAQGVQPGMPLKTALNLVPELDILRADQAREEQVLVQQARWLYRHVAHISLYPPDGLLAEIGSVQRLYGGAAGVWQNLEQALVQRHLTARMATGRTPMAARLLARAGLGECTSDTGRLDRRVASLPLAAAGFEERTLARLARLGLTQLGQCLELPPAELAHRLEPETLAHLQKILGQRPDPQPPWQPPHYFHQQADFVQEIEQAQGLLFPLQRMLQELEEDLRWRQQDTDSLLLALSHREQEPTRLHIRTSGPEHRAEAFLNLARIRFEQHPLKAPVIRLALSVQRFLSREAAVEGDLLGETQNPTEAWHTLISRLQARLGPQALQQLAPQADHRPERAWSSTDIQGKQHQHRNQHEFAALPQRPLWLLKAPHPLSETPAAWFTGPERISGGWWDGQPVHRDYYIAQLHSGQLAWVFRDVRDGWFIHGWFG